LLFHFHYAVFVGSQSTGFIDKTKKVAVLDTPGHAAFEEMRERGAKVWRLFYAVFCFLIYVVLSCRRRRRRRCCRSSSLLSAFVPHPQLCDVAILVVDATRGVQDQTMTCIQYLKNSTMEIVVALNKIDMKYYVHFFFFRFLSFHYVFLSIVVT
jgi:translation initiation factor IF-2